MISSNKHLSPLCTQGFYVENIISDKGTLDEVMTYIFHIQFLSEI